MIHHYAHVHPDGLLPGQNVTLDALFQYTCLGTLVSCAIVIVAFIVFREARLSFYTRMGFYLIISDFGQFLTSYFILVPPGPQCVLQGVFIAYFDWPCILWPLCMAITTYLVVVKHVTNAERYEKWFHVLCWVFPLIIVALPFATNQYGPAGDVCWLTEEGAGNIWRMLMYYVWLWVIIIVMCVLYGFTAVSLRRQRAVMNAKQQMNFDVLRLALYPLILLICWSGNSAARVYEAFHNTPINNFGAQVFFQFSVVSVGIWDSLAFFLQPQMRNVMQRRLCCRSERVVSSVGDRDPMLYLNEDGTVALLDKGM